MSFLCKLFKIFPGEEWLVLRFILLSAMMQAGLTAGITAADSIFFIQIGVESLPIVYIAAPFLMLLYVPIVTVLLARYGIKVVMQLSNTLILVGGVFFFFAFHLLANANDQHPIWLIYAAKLYSYLWYVAVYSTLWNFIDNHFDLQSGKRLYGLFSAGAALGAMFGGALVKGITMHFTVHTIFLAWSIFAVLSYFILIWIRKKDKIVEGDEFEDTENSTVTQQIGKIYNTFKSSRFALLLTLVLFSTLTLTGICEFITIGILSEGKSEEELAGLFGVLTMVANGLNLIINLFIFNKLISFAGVRSTTLVQPLIYLAIFAYYSFNDTLVAAFFGYMAYQTVLVSIDNNNYNFLFNALPASGKEELRTFIEGFCEPLATAAAGLFLLAYGAHLPTPILASIALVIVLVMIICVLILRADYVPALVVNLRSYWLDFSLPLEKTLKELPPSDVEALIHFCRSSDPNIAITAIRFLWMRNQKLALEMFLEFLTTLPSCPREPINQLLHDILREEKPEIVTQFLLWLESDQSERIKQEPVLLETLALYGLVSTNQLKHWQKSTSGSHEGVTTLTRLHSWRLDDNQESLAHLQTLLAGSIDEQLIAIRILGNSKKPNYAYALPPFISGQNKELRIAALKALKHLACRDLASLIPHITDRLRYGDAEENPILLDILENINDVGSVEVLLEFSAHFTPTENRQIEDLMLKIGQKSIPTIVKILNNNQLTYKSRACAAKGLSHLSFSQFEMIFQRLVEKELDIGKQYARDYQKIKNTPQQSKGLELLARFYAEQTLAVADFVLHLYSLMGLLPDGELIRAYIYSENLKDKANAQETIEQSCGRTVSRQIFALINTVLTPKAPLKQNALSKDALEALLYRILENEVNLPAAFAIQALWEISSERLLAKIKERLQTENSSRVNQTLRSLIRRIVTKETNPTELNFVEKSYAMANSELLGNLELTEIDYLMHSLKVQEFETQASIFKQNDTSHHIYFLERGTAYVTHTTNTLSQEIGPGKALGHEALLANTDYQTSAQAGNEGCRLFAFNKETLYRAMDIYPNVGIHFLTLKVNYQQ